MELSEKSIFSLMNSRYEHKNILYEHLHLSLYLAK